MAPKAGPVPTGYQTHDSFFASRFAQGGRTVYSLDLSPMQLTSLVSRPNPEAPVESNRQIRLRHAREFANYFREHDRWVIPGIILRSAEKFKFDITDEVAGTKFGILQVARSAARGINILDGQHRILGFFIALDAIAADLEYTRERLQMAERNDPGGAAVRDYKQRIAELNAQLSRLETDRVAIQVYIEEDPVAYRQMFFDISDNALGITASVRSRFDSRRVVNRALPMILEHPLLAGRVEMELDRLNRKSEEFVTAKHVVDIAKNIQVGFTGRIGRVDNEKLREQSVAADTKAFLDTLTESFPQLEAMRLGHVLPRNLRRNSLLGAGSFLRILAGVYHELLLPNKHGWSREQVGEFFAKLAPHVSNDGSPVYPGSIWTEHMPDGLFQAGALAPSGRTQDLNRVYGTLVDWALDKPAFLDEPPVEKPRDLTDEDLMLAEEERLERAEREAKQAS